MNLETYLRTTNTTQEKFAKKIGCTQGLVSQWLTGRTEIPAERAVEIEEATDGKVTRKELRPDLYAARA